MSDEFDFTKGGTFAGGYFPPLKSLSSALRSWEEASSIHFLYEPGNGTRYDVLLTTTQSGETTLTLINFRKAMVIPSEMGVWNMTYMQEKLGINLGDCYALIPLINSYLKKDWELDNG